MSFCFKNKQRVRQKSDFDHVFKKRKRLFGRYFLVYYRQNTLEYPRLGVIASKRNVRHAVDRNQLRRIAKEGFRLMQQDLPRIDVILVAKKGASNADKQELRQCINQLLTKLAKSQNQS